MDLNEYFEAGKHGDKAVFAKAVGISAMTLSSMIVGRKLPGPKLAVRMRSESGCRLTLQRLRPNDWMEIWPELTAEASEGRPIPPAAAVETVKAASHV